jgi:hypothetical protein
MVEVLAGFWQVLVLVFVGWQGGAPKNRGKGNGTKQHFFKALQSDRSKKWYLPQHWALF